MSVAEAMLAGCVPVTTGAGSLPEVTGECGVLLASTEAPDVAAAIQAGLTYTDEARLSIRTRILNEFPMKNRREHLEQLIEPLMNGH